MFIDAFIEPGVDPTLLMAIDFVIWIHIIAFISYWLLLARDLIKGTDSAYPYKNVVQDKKSSWNYDYN